MTDKSSANAKLLNSSIFLIPCALFLSYRREQPKELRDGAQESRFSRLLVTIFPEVAAWSHHRVWQFTHLAVLPKQALGMLQELLIDLGGQCDRNC